MNFVFSLGDSAKAENSYTALNCWGINPYTIDFVLPLGL
jgi:hypothetical protein